jgi:hypothetical protein
MVRYHKRISLYEVMTKAGHKLSYDKNLEKVHPDQPPPQQSPPTPPQQQSSPAPLPQQISPTPPPQKFDAWPTKPKPFQLNAGRIEISLPYQIAIAVPFVVILLLLMAYRLGQYTSSHASDSDASLDNAAGKKSQVSSNSVTIVSQTAQQPKVTATQAPLPADQTGNNRIVIQTYKLRSHLEPVKQYFAQFGIATEILQVGDWYYLVTKNKYDNPQKPGTSGFYARQKIIELGANYKAPPGFEPFGDKPFSDAFGMKFDE